MTPYRDEPYKCAPAKKIRSIWKTRWWRFRIWLAGSFALRSQIWRCKRCYQRAIFGSVLSGDALIDAILHESKCQGSTIGRDSVLKVSGWDVARD